MNERPLLEQLIEAFRCLPGVGQKSAQRMAYHLLQKNRQGGILLSNTLQKSMQDIGQCKVCRNLTEDDICTTCNNEKRDRGLLCVVESPSDVMALEQATHYHGLYFVLMGRLSPLDGMGPEAIGMNLLEKRLASGEVKELILATNPTVEGEATAFYISEMAQSYAVNATRIAHGVPLGGELEYVDSGTLSHAFSGRQSLL